ncbi:MAG: glycine--tRNA ligase [Candidatus Marsarchaeota archaeon]|nr:glycine--tRNA ligase [Candidatus Marsarchaeota archaeon]
MNIEELIAFAKRRGLFWPSAEIYGGAAGTYDYGDVGALLKRNWENAWLAFFVDTNPDYHLIEGAVILPEAPLVFSGHAAKFNDVVVECSKCSTFYRADVLLKESGVAVSEGASSAQIDKELKEHKVRCPHCKAVAWMPSKPFNMMMDVGLGPERATKGYLRPETAQSAYLNFFREFNVLRKSLPLGLAIIGRAFRNEISPRQGLYRMRELVQAELQIFFDPESWKVDFKSVSGRKVKVRLYGKAADETVTLGELVKEHGIPEFYAYHMGLIDAFYRDAIGVPDGKLRFLEKGGDEKAFYNKVHMDIEADIESWGGFNEIGGLHYRGDYDLTQHSKGSKQDHSVLANGKKVMPNVLELSFGVDRNVWMLADMFYKKDGERAVLQIKPFLAPFKAALFSLQKEPELDIAVGELYRALRPHFKLFLDQSGSIGRRYARMDEIGTPFCITVDYDTVSKDSPNYGTVTVRSRDDRKQIRLKVSELEGYISKAITFNPYDFFAFD